MDNTGKSLLEGMERLGLMASHIRKNEGQIAQIEIDIILGELRSLYVAALQLEASEKGEASGMEDGASSAADSIAKKAAEEKRLAEEAAAKKAAEEKRLAEEAAAKKAAEEKRLAEEAAAKKAAEERARKIVEDEFHPVFAPATDETEPTPIMEPQLEQLAGNPNDELFAEETAAKKEVPSLTELFKVGIAEEQPKVRTLADTLGQRKRNVEEQLETRVNAKKVDDLRTIININDKFSFMSELFHNNMKAYNDFILRLNATAGREEALAYVADTAALNRWDDNSSAVKAFYKIFDRKF